MTSQETRPVLIIGAGVSGLTFAQACRKSGIPYRIFERDESATHRSAGWGLTIHWALPTFKSLLPEDIVSRFPETYVNREAVAAGEKGSFTFYELSTGKARWQVPAAERIRVYREKLRKLLLSGINVEWSKTLTGINVTKGSAQALFADGSSESGSIVIGCDGAKSLVRRLMHPQDYANDMLPVRFIGAGVVHDKETVDSILKLDPYFLQGSDPRTDVFLWFSFLETPADGMPEDKYRCQIMVSWPYREGFLDRVDPTEMLNTKIGQLSFMRHVADQWAEPFRSIVHSIPHDAEVRPTELGDYLPRQSEGFDGRVALVGDAAHAMVKYRGEGANHAIVDVPTLLDRIRPLYANIDITDGSDGAKLSSFAAVRSSYEQEMIERSSLAVAASRRACLDAHDYPRINDKSPLVRRRLMRADLED